MQHTLRDAVRSSRVHRLGNSSDSDESNSPQSGERRHHAIYAARSSPLHEADCFWNTVVIVGGANLHHKFHADGRAVKAASGEPVNPVKCRNKGGLGSLFAFSSWTMSIPVALQILFTIVKTALHPCIFTVFIIVLLLNCSTAHRDYSGMSQTRTTPSLSAEIISFLSSSMIKSPLPK